MHIKALLTAVLSLALVSFTLSVELEVKSLLDDKIEIKIPKGFTIMDQEMLELKYPAANRPKLVYSNERGTINVAFTQSTSKASQEQLEEFLGFMKKTFQVVHKDADFLSDGIKEVNGRKVGYMELITNAIDTRIYNLMFFTDLDGKLLICSFNCTDRYIEKWKGAASEIMSSLKVK